MTFIKLNQADLDSPRRELFNGGLENVVALLVRWQINFLCESTGGPIQLCLETPLDEYKYMKMPLELFPQ